VAEEHWEIAPRGFFQIGRRNLWGKNRRLDLFTRLVVRPRDPPLTDVPLPALQQDSGGRFYEYRVLGQFREPKAFDTPADVVLTGLVEQARRSSFDFIRKEARAEAGFPGVIARVITPEGTWTGTSGTAGPDTDAAPAATDHIRVGSITKTITGTVLLQLVDEGLISLDDPVSTYDPDANWAAVQ
jgi:hypothetical protein